MSRDDSIQAVVFDMGGVIVRLASLADVLRGVDLPTEELWRRWILSESVRRFEGGHCTVDEFAAGLIAELGVELDHNVLIERFLAFPQGLFDGAVDLVADVASRGVTTGVLSNTNGAHWETQPDHEVVQAMFDRRFLSYELGMLKPDAAIYEHVVADLGCAPHQIVFIDDNQVNVDGALAIGMRAVVAKGPAEARRALIDLGVI